MGKEEWRWEEKEIATWSKVSGEKISCWLGMVFLSSVSFAFGMDRCGINAMVLGMMTLGFLSGAIIMGLLSFETKKIRYQVKR